MIAMRRPDDEGERPELDEFTARRLARMSGEKLWGEFQRHIAEYNERNQRDAEK
ncbi:hypothetical protein WCD74_11650 [Actinomycetospora sp. OC33-EN08]|uniref:Uncharacterized protein n=1 Tax=Actinomycetospora aurantiaca TaxID=3129233 RepID=A0ABU8MMS3_9PSEU